MTRHRSTLQRGLTASAIVVLLLAQLGALIHTATVRHVRCEHGELVDAPVLAKSSLDLSQLVAVSDSGDTDCDHCVLANGLRSDSSVTAPSIALARQAASTPSVAILQPYTRTSALYRTAPKTSPPA